jgi:thymidylate synthase (FAD)
MKIIKPLVELLWITPNAEKIIEIASRTCYKSESKITEDSAGNFCKMIIKRGHLAMIEHGVASLKFIIDRGLSHELVRHRLCSFAQESTRWVSYKNEIEVIEPLNLDELSRIKWISAIKFAENRYKDLLNNGIKPEMARSVLPTCLKTEIVVTANFREWLKIFELRISNTAHPQIKSIMIEAKEILKKQCPNIFGNINENKNN